jgi:hypothetical protein
VSADERSDLTGTSSEATVFPETVFSGIDPVVSGESSCSEAIEPCSASVLLPLDVLRGEYGGTSLGEYGGGGPGGNLGRTGIGSGKVTVMRIAVVEYTSSWSASNSTSLRRSRTALLIAATSAAGSLL